MIVNSFTLAYILYTLDKAGHSCIEKCVWSLVDIWNHTYYATQEANNLVKIC